MNGMAYYKAAGSEDVYKIAGRVVPYEKGMEGFLICSFSGERFIILDEKATFANAWLNNDKGVELSDERERYGKTFQKFHDRLKEGSFSKLVLSREKWVEERVDIDASFEKACQLYKDQTVMFFSSELTGTWLVVTPELLVKMRETVGETMALAGTMKKGEKEWSEKNREEHNIVAEYISTKLKECCDVVNEEKPRTVEAGELLHLRSDFAFHSKKSWSEIAKRLHPTPAVCGLPADRAYDFICENEGYDRLFYSGYCGVAKDDVCLLHVTLRCMQIANDGYWLYAGGGILKESDAESEWKETENKMNTIRRCIVTKGN